MNEMGVELVVDRDVTVDNNEFSFELGVARACVIDFIERYSELTDALIEWGKAYAMGEVSGGPPRPPHIDDVSKVILVIARVAEVQAKLRQTIGRKDFIEVVTAMAEVVDRHVASPVVKRGIQREWQLICAKHVI
jgi:hypothetical protein